MIKYPKDTPFADYSDMEVRAGSSRRIGLSTRALDIARYKSLDAIVLRPQLLGVEQLGPAIEIPFDMVREVCEEMLMVAEAGRPIEVFGQALPSKRVELTTEEYGRLKDLIGECEEYIRGGEYNIGEGAEQMKLLRKALQAVLDLGLE
jgi:hypothetical protein